MTLEEIFAEKPELLNEPCVQKLIRYMKENHARTFGIVDKLNTQESELLNACMNSEFIVIGGIPLRDTMRKLFEIFEKNC